MYNEIWPGGKTQHATSICKVSKALHFTSEQLSEDTDVKDSKYDQY